MSEIGIQSITRRALEDDQFRQRLAHEPLLALEGYDLTVDEDKTLRLFIQNGWLPKPPAERTQKAA